MSRFIYYCLYNQYVTWYSLNKVIDRIVTVFNQISHLDGVTLKEKRNMMYNNKLVAVVKVDGKILREDGETVYIPFGSEYSIHFKNLSGVKAVVDVTIDGEDVLDGSSLVVRPNNDSKIEGFMRGNGVSHKFKFIEKTSQISEHRGDKISDGLIRISFKFEKPVIRTEWYSSTVHRSPFDSDIRYGSSAGTGDMRLHSRGISSYASQVDSQPVAKSINDDGITVKGSASDQSFATTTVGALESQEHTIVFQLKGETGNGKIEEPILIKTKIKCDTCGKSGQLRSKFCSNCGTSLVV